MSEVYITVQGDMWDGIAKRLYGSEAGMNALLKANQDYADTVVFPANVKLNVPDYTTLQTSLLPLWRR